jgi:chemotaxis protein methyltransferase CheR
LSAVRFPGAIFHRHSLVGAEVLPRSGIWPRGEETPVVFPPEKSAPVRRAEMATARAEPREPRPVAPEPAPPAPLLAAARTLANQGKLAEATAACDQLLAWHKLEPAAHYLRAVIFEERSEPENAIAALRKALYLEPEVVVAHWHLGNLMRARERWTEAERHFENALALLRRRPADEVIPETDGLTAGSMIEMITSAQAAGSVLRTK